MSTQQPQPASTRKLQWGTPAPEYIKCNVDVAIFQDSRSFGVDCCFKDSTSHFIRAKTSWYQGIPTTHEAEVSSLLAAISSTSEIHLQNIIFEIDCRANVDVLSSKNFTNSEVGIILRCCARKLSYLRNCSVQFVGKQVNHVVYCLTRTSRSFAC